MTKRVAILLIILAATSSPVHAHEMRPAYLEIRETAPDTYDVRWKVPAQGETKRLGLHLRFADDVEFLDEPISGFAANAHFQRSQIRRIGGLTGTLIAVDGLAGTYTDVILRMEWTDGRQLTTRLTPDVPSYMVATHMGIELVAWTYFVLGMEHILLGIDHLLFVFALLLVVADWRKLVFTITAFTLAHSITLALATLGWIHLPGPPVEAIIALSIVFVAAEIVRGNEGKPGVTARWPWVVSFTFGLLHGFGFASALHEIGLPTESIPLALLTFNLGVESGQLFFVGVVLIVYAILHRTTTLRPRGANFVPAYAIGGVAAFWTIERIAGFWTLGT